ncbi:MAG: peroxiredoxin family protein [Muribaculum sp.]|nr:peroxiredoxin family protein [Muribaculum sp.]
MNFKLKMAGVFAGLVGMVALTSAISTENVPLEVGNQAPEISAVSADGNTLHLSDLKGEDVIVNFWSVKDAESRIRNVRLARKAESEGVNYVGICVDSEKDLAREVLKADNLHGENQFFADERIRKEYQLDQGTRTVKIDPYGIVAKID